MVPPPGDGYPARVMIMAEGTVLKGPHMTGASIFAKFMCGNIRQAETLGIIRVISRAPWLLLFICLGITAACLDRIPDPPAVRESRVDSQAAPATQKAARLPQVIIAAP